MRTDLFDNEPLALPSRESLGDGAVVLREFALAHETELLSAVHDITSRAPLRHLITPGGFRMSVAMSNCGALGWVSDRSGYRYDRIDPLTDQPWPPMPPVFSTLAAAAAAEAGYDAFVPDACLLNRYAPGARLTLHQDRNEHDLSQPIVSVSLGLPAVFQFGGEQRGDKTRKYPLVHGDVAVWGGATRLRFHGVLPLKPGVHPLLGEYRYNLTFRRAR